MATATQPTPADARADRAERASRSSFQFAVSRSAFLEALNRAATALPKRGTLPILSCVLVRAGAGSLTLTCSDLEQVVDTRLAGVASSDRGEAALPAKRLMEIVNALPPSAMIELTVTDNRTKLVAGRAKFDLLGMAVEEFPKVVLPPSEASATTSGKALAGLLGRVSSHVKVSESAGSNPAIAGILLDVGETGAFLVGTDGHRLIRLAVALTHGAQPLVGQYVIPKLATASIVKLFGADEAVTIEGTRQKLTLSGSDSTLTLSVIGEKFPHYQHLLAFPSVAHAIVERADLAAAAKRVAIASSEERIECTLTGAEITIRAESSDAGRGEDVLSAAFTSSADAIALPYTIAFNPRYLLDSLDAIQGEQVRIDFGGGMKPVYVRDAAQAEGSGALNVAVALPLRAKGDTTPSPTTKTSKAKGGK